MSLKEQEPKLLIKPRYISNVDDFCKRIADLKQQLTDMQDFYFSIAAGGVEDNDNTEETKLSLSTKLFHTTREFNEGSKGIISSVSQLYFSIYDNTVAEVSCHKLPETFDRNVEYLKAVFPSWRTDIIKK